MSLPCPTCNDEPCPECNDRGWVYAGTGDYGDERVGCGFCLGEPCPECGPADREEPT